TFLSIVCSLFLSYLWSRYCVSACFSSFLCNSPATTVFYTLSLHDALPICWRVGLRFPSLVNPVGGAVSRPERHSFCGDAVFSYRSEEHTSELQSRFDLVCRLLLEKKKMDHRCQLYSRQTILTRKKCMVRST